MNELKAADKFLAGINGHQKVKPRLRGEGSQSWEENGLWELFEVCQSLSGVGVLCHRFAAHAPYDGEIESVRGMGEGSMGVLRRYAFDGWGYRLD